MSVQRNRGQTTTTYTHQVLVIAYCSFGEVSWEPEAWSGSMMVEAGALGCPSPSPSPEQLLSKFDIGLRLSSAQN